MTDLKLSQSLEDYLEIIHILHLRGRIARVRDIAAALTVKMPSVAQAIAILKKIGMVVQEPYKGVTLTEKGKNAAASIFGKHVLIREFLMHLGVPETIANKDACSMEHILSKETLTSIEHFMETKNA